MIVNENLVRASCGSRNTVSTNLWVASNRSSYFNVRLGLVFVILNGFPCDPENEMEWEIKQEDERNARMGSNAMKH